MFMGGINMYDENEDNDEWLLDEVTGEKRKPAMAVLNKRKLSRFEMDNLFTSEE